MATSSYTITLILLINLDYLLLFEKLKLKISWVQFILCLSVLVVVFYLNIAFKKNFQGCYCFKKIKKISSNIKHNFKILSNNIINI